MIRSDNDLFPRSAYLDVALRAPHRLRRVLGPLAPSRSVNLSYRRQLHAMADALGDGTSVLVIGAGAQKSWLHGFFAKRTSVRVVYSDVDVRGMVDLFCDAHELPFLDGTFDGVIASAVLEHVVYPERVASEIHRVLARDGLIYSEIPFLQQVHEGAYDFTRYTLSGHRRLLNHFEELSSGIVAGPGTTLTWAIEHFVICCTPRFLVAAARIAVRLAFFWLKYVDHLFAQSPSAADGASCTFFFGRKSGSVRSNLDIVERYAGVKRLLHT